jgi:predicted transcriptional regulator
LEGIERLVAEDGDRLARVAEGFDEADAGAGVDGERVHGWMKSWFTDDELPRP